MSRRLMRLLISLVCLALIATTLSKCLSDSAKVRHAERVTAELKSQIKVGMDRENVVARLYGPATQQIACFLQEGEPPTQMLDIFLFDTTNPGSTTSIAIRSEQVATNKFEVIFVGDEESDQISIFTKSDHCNVVRGNQVSA